MKKFNLILLSICLYTFIGSNSGCEKEDPISIDYNNPCTPYFAENTTLPQNNWVYNQMQSINSDPNLHVYHVRMYETGGSGAITFVFCYSNTNTFGTDHVKVYNCAGQELCSQPYLDFQLTGCSFNPMATYNTLIGHWRF